ncbi:hypothetical protein AB0368_05240 [Actinoplanes sp. NPDC051475]|uniref:hypothetical protein n=1 Tax=Actinoplanes sp. NPDC051475 TaxID=3157225 RepID=UPI00344E058E
MADARGRRRVVAATLAIVLAGLAIGAARVTTPRLGPDYVAIENVVLRGRGTAAESALSAVPGGTARAADLRLPRVLGRAPDRQ